MKKILFRELKRNKDFLEIDLEKVKIVFSTAENKRSFNRHTEEGKENINSIISEYNVNDVKYLNQIHSDRVIIYKNNNDEIIDEEGDAIITSEERVAVGVFTADCIPVLIVDEEKGVVAAIHSGWKGTFNSITLKTLNIMKDKYKTNPSKIKVYIGAHIRQCCYEVSEELKERFLEHTGIAEEELFDGRKLNMERCILKDLQESGINEENIYSLNLCTNCENKIKLHSYRASVGTYGRLFSFIFIK